jgi:ferredoxin-type protein NapH
MARNKSGTTASKLARWRWLVQSGFLFAWLDPLALRMHNVCSPVFHCYSCPLATFACPIGVLANFSYLHQIPFAALGILLFFGAAFGSFICGWACPFGFLQDLIARIPTPKFTLPDWMGYFRYVSLIVLVLAIPFFLGESSPLFFCRLCPAGALEGAVPNVVQSAIAGNAVAWPSAVKMIILVLVLIAMFFTWRPWCALFCPLGAIYSLFDPVSLFFLRFNKNLCKNCTLCRSLCHDKTHPQERTNGLRCIRCMDCTKCNAVAVGTVLTRFTDKITDTNEQDAV